ncbi:glutamate-cysteine ligase family protein [Paenibacillus sp. TRM 82003]|uniref:glutamate-cysteine ligase family protein n=1 Tax=Kineococcus sp. TRM81007 TaxID=2925831 RepID=UPI001F56BDC4|nr:glutamate-cysteine ligase family protein [Kineococcus sp. TRM81007]MCI2240012.1 glutamate-cysteine ligase family protein [Kineococcus sp. TRM81007]MCI3925683.1 glutamate-cysteine ligase family protein [Paenibacillus sp. TRM 82003]
MLSSVEQAVRDDAGEHAAPLDADAVREHVTAGALRDGPVGSVGLELERHAVDLHHPHRRVAWDRLTGALREAVPPAGSRVTLEPGGQVELSSPPLPGVAAAVEALRRDAAHLDALLAADGIALLSTGTDLVREPVRVNPGSRYAAMAEHFTAAGHAVDGAAMMCSTASLQVNLDAGPAHRWPQRLAHLHRLLPALAALGACSPLLAGRTDGTRSTRQGVWRRLEPGRCTRPADGTGGPDPAGEWAAFALAAPVMLVRDGEDAPCRPVLEPVPLADWAGGRRLLHGRPPTAADVDLHLSTLWPPVRMRGFLEVRVLDAVPAAWWPGLAAVVATVVDDERAADAAAAAVDACGNDTARAARGLLDAALPAVPTALRSCVEVWADLLDAGHHPADLVLDRVRRGGPTGCLTAEELR